MSATATVSASSDTDRYRSVEKLIHLLVHRSCWARGGDRDDLLSVAHLAFMRALRSWDPNRGAFTTHVYWWVWGSLMHHHDAEQKQRHGELPAEPAARDRFDLQRFVADLGEDARAVARLAVGRREPDGVRRGDLVWDTLRDVGWSGRRILEAFDEVSEALTA